MTATPASMTPTLALMVGGVYWNDYGNFIGGETSEVQTGLMPFALTGPSDAIIGSILVAPASKAGSPSMLNLDTDGYLQVNMEAGVITSGTVTADQGTAGTAAAGWYARLTDGTNVIGTSTYPIVASEALLDGSISTAGHTLPGNYVAIGGSDGTYLRPVLTDASGHLQVDVVSADNIAAPNGTPPAAVTYLGAYDVNTTHIVELQMNTSSNYGLITADAWNESVIENDALNTGATIYAVGGYREASTDYTSMQMDADGYLQVNVKAGTFYQTTQPVSNAGLTAIDDVITTTGSTAPTYAVLMGASNGTDLEALQVDSSGFLKVNVAAGSSGNAAAAATGAAVPTDADYIGAKNSSGDLVGLLVDASGHLEVSVQQSNNVLLATTPVSVTSTVTTESETASVSGQCVVVSLSCVTAQTMAYPVAVRVRDTTNGIITAWQLCPIQIAGSGCTLYFNLPVSNGDTVDIDMIAQGTVGSVSTNVTAVLSPLAIPTDLRPDGRSLPQSTQVAMVSETVTAVAIAAPTSPARIMIGGVTLSIDGNVTGCYTVLEVTINGAAAFACGVQANNLTQNSTSRLWPQGLLCDPGSGVIVGQGLGGTGMAQIDYDIVV